MIGILLITHSTLGDALIHCACHVLNRRPPQIAALGIASQEDPRDLLPLARTLLQMVDSGDGVLVLTDLYGATPANVAQKLVEPGRVEAAAGLSLPMLMRALTYRERDMATLVSKTISGGRDGVILMKGEHSNAAG